MQVLVYLEHETEMVDMKRPVALTCFNIARKVHRILAGYAAAEGDVYTALQHWNEVVAHCVDEEQVRVCGVGVGVGVRGGFEAEGRCPLCTPAPSTPLLGQPRRGGLR